MLILKTLNGSPTGYVRIERENGKSRLTIMGVKMENLQAIAMNAECCAALAVDEYGCCESEFEPDALAMLNEQGDVMAVAAPRGAQEAVISRARRLTERKKAPHAEATPQRKDMPSQERRTEAAAPVAVQPQQQETHPTDEKPPMDNLPDVRSICRAWPPPPFFPDARFKDGAWWA